MNPRHVVSRFARAVGVPSHSPDPTDPSVAERFPNTYFDFPIR